MKSKTWVEKLNDSKDLPKVVQLTGKAAAKWGEKMMVIPSPLEVDGLMKKVPKGKVTTTNEIRNQIAIKHGADIGCPLTTGIFSWIAANAAEEEAAEGKKKITPYWRTLKQNGEINAKFPGGIKNQIEKLTAEGHNIIKKGSRFFVEDYINKLVKNFS